MPDTVKKIAHLILKYWRQELDEEELNELLDWANQSADNKETFSRLTNPDFIVSNLRELSVVKQEMRDRIWDELSITDSENDPITERDIRGSSSFINRHWKWLAAAAVLLLVVAILMMRMGYCEPAASSTASLAGADRKETIPVPQPQQQLTGNLLQLPDGSSVITDTISNHSTRIYQALLSLVKDSGKLIISYAGHGSIADSAQRSTISTPIGGTCTLVLPDGTEVWLNSASSITFPVVFSGNERVVEVTGESWFNVQRSSAGGRYLPFIVHTARMDLEVLGTRFNVNVYPQENLATVTLEEGRLRVWKKVDQQPGNKMSGEARVDVILSPGQQAQLSNSDGTNTEGGIRVEPVKLAEALSWKQGEYIFTDIDFETFARQLTRWYNARFEYPGGKPVAVFSGRFRRSDSLTTILRSLESSGHVTFRLIPVNNTVIVTNSK